MRGNIINVSMFHLLKHHFCSFHLFVLPPSLPPPFNSYTPLSFSFSIFLTLCSLGCPARALLSNPLLLHPTWNFMFSHFRHPDATFFSPCRWLFMHATTQDWAHFRCAATLLPYYSLTDEWVLPAVKIRQLDIYNKTLLKRYSVPSRFSSKKMCSRNVHIILKTHNKE